MLKLNMKYALFNELFKQIFLIYLKLFISF